MAGISGMPSGTKPADLDPLAGPPPAAAANSAPDPLAGGPPVQTPAADQAQSQGYQGPGSSTLQGIANIAPEGMGIAGGIAGRTAGIPGMTGMGMAMAAGGMGIRQVIEQDILGSKPKQDADQRMIDMRDAAGKIGAELLAGEGAIRGVVKGGAAALETQVGKVVADKLSSTVQPILDYAGNFVDGIKKNLIKPAADWLEQNMAQGTAEESGNAIKDKLTSGISAQYDGLKQRYATINGVAASTPMSDASRQALSDGIRKDAVGLPQNLYKLAKTYADKVDAGSSAADIHEMLTGLNGDIAQASQRQTSSAIRDKLGALQQIGDRTTDFMENYTHGIAKRIASGGATPSEMDAFGQMMEQQANPTVPVGEANLPKYAKSVAQDYIDQRSAVTKSYAQFRGYLSDLGDQAGVNADKLGPTQIMRKLNDMNPEDLVSNMYLPKNAEALRTMSKADPEAFQLVKQARIRDIYNKSMVDGQVDMKKLVSNFDALPESARPLIISDADRTALRSVANSSNLSAIDGLHDNMVSNFVKSAIGITRTGALAGAKVARDAYGTAAGKTLAAQAVGGAGVAATGRNPVPGQ